MFGAGKPSTVMIRGKIAFVHIPSFLGKIPKNQTNTFLIQLCLHWNFTESRAVLLRTVLDVEPDCSLQAGLKGLGGMAWLPSDRKSFVCDHFFLGKALQAINNPYETAVDKFAGNKKKGVCWKRHGLMVLAQGCHCQSFDRYSLSASIYLLWNGLQSFT